MPDAFVLWICFLALLGAYRLGQLLRRGWVAYWLAAGKSWGDP